MKRGGHAKRTVVRLAGVWRSFAEGGSVRRVLQGVDLSAAPGERIALLGRSGCGKSTLLNLIGGIDLPDRGQVTVAGRRMETLSEHTRTLVRRRKLGFVFQLFNLVPTLTVEENLHLPLELNGWRRRAAAARVREMLDAVGLGARGRSFPDTLSGGEQQRVALARAAVHRPSVILADEPTGNLDAETGEQVLALLDALARDQDTALIMVTHSRTVAARADRVLVLRDGRLSPGGEA